MSSRYIQWTLTLLSEFLDGRDVEVFILDILT